MKALVRRGLAGEIASRLSCLEVEASCTAGIAALQKSQKLPRAELTDDEIASLVRQELETQLLGRIRHLRVSATSNFVILAGSCSSYYTKQLAQHVAMELLGTERLINNIDVLPPK